MREKQNYVSNEYSGIDRLNRKIPTREEVGPIRPNRYVGLFYFLWLGHAGLGGLYDNTQILANHPEAIHDPDHPAWGPLERYHFWGEPLYGYYFNDDDWVLRKHVRLLAAAGVDFIVFDTTNAATYPMVYEKLFKIMDEVDGQGFRVPRIVFYTNTESGKTINGIYEKIYKENRYEHLYFQWDGKPLIIGDPTECTEEQRQYFTFRLNQWPFDPVKENGFPWIEFERPQRVYYNERGEKEVISVSVAQHPSCSMSDTPFYGYGGNWGRGFHKDADNMQGDTPDDILRGANVIEQWEFALEEDPQIVFVTGWNEWIAMRLPGQEGRPILFVDQCTLNFSRDIEPMKGGYGDNYYMQLISYIRKFKGMPDSEDTAHLLAESIEMEKDFSPWRQVEAEYRDCDGDTTPRDYAGYGNFKYTNNTGRNELLSFKVAHNDENLYFYARTKQSITSYESSNWMMLLLRIEGEDTNWEGYSYIVNRTVKSDSTTVLEKSEGGWNWAPVSDLKYAVHENELHVKIPRNLIGLSDSNQERRIEFKWCDNMLDKGDSMDFYQFGDTAPEGRLNFVYSLRDE